MSDQCAPSELDRNELPISGHIKIFKEYSSIHFSYTHVRTFSLTSTLTIHLTGMKADSTIAQQQRETA